MNLPLPIASAVLVATVALGCGPEAYPASYAPGASNVVPTAGDGSAVPIAQCSYEPGPAPEVGSRRRRAASSVRIEADQPASTTTLVLDGGKLDNDPQIVAGDRFVILYTAHNYKILDKSTGELVAAEQGDEIPPESTFGHLFSPLWSPRDKRGAENATNLNRLLRFTDAERVPCDEENPLHSRSCVQEFYDTRIMWDPLRKRFWVESAARNHFWLCTKHKDDDDDDDSCGGDPKRSSQARRFITVAVSISDDPRKGWHRYALTDEYTDWPKIAVQDRYLLLGYLKAANVYVFDADRLAAGNPDRGPVRVAKIDVRALGGGIKHLSLVTHHGPTNGFTFLVGTGDSGVVTPFGLYNPDPGRAAPPVLVRGPAVDVGSEFGSFEDNPVYRDGQLYLTKAERADRSGHVHRLRVVRLPVRGVPGRSPSIWSAADPRAGFLSFPVGGREPFEPADDDVSYDKPALDVNGHGDVVIVFSRKGYRTRVPLPAEVRYAILYHGESQPRASVLLKRGTEADLPGKAVIDLAFAQTDPVDDWTVWVSHAYEDAAVRGFRQVGAAIRP